MGVRGLTTYIAENSKLYLQPYELHNMNLVVDGSNIAAQLYRWSSQSHSAFGGDYDEYYKTVADFFAMLFKCQVTPIVLFDGGYEKKKLKSFFSRSVATIPLLKNLNKGFCDAKFFPLFMKQTFFDVMSDMDILCIQCDFEADIELAAVARVLNCPVLSYDSDFYIFDVLYIPFSTVYSKPVQFPGSERFYIRCSVFNVTSFLSQFSGLNKSHLPVMATLLGNDYIGTSLFQKFYEHVLMPKTKKKSFTQRKIPGVLNWLKKENVLSARKLILTHVGNKNAKKVLDAFRLVKNNYTCIFVSRAVLDGLRNIYGDVSLKNKEFPLYLPPKIKELYSQCKIHKFIIDMIFLNTYFTPLQVENVYRESSHMPTLPLIRNIYALLFPYAKNPLQLKLFLSVKRYYAAVIVKKDLNNFLNNVCLDEILEESEKERLKWLCSIVGVNDDDLNILPADYWSIFLMSFIYWIKKLKDSIKSTHLHALILMVIANEIVQKHTGYFRSHAKYMKKKGIEISKLKAAKVELKESTTFSEMLENVTSYEKRYIQGVLFPYRFTIERSTGRAYDISELHLFGCFQSCLFHVMQLNALLNYPLPHLKVSDFYSGTLLYNLYLAIKSKPSFGIGLFKETPNLAKIYTYLCENLFKFSPNVNPKVKKAKKRKHKKNKISEEIEIVFYEDDDEDIDYQDDSNIYAILRNAST